MTQMPPSMPRRTLRKSPEPRTSPYSVEPQFGYRIQNSMNGIIASVASSVSDRFAPRSVGASVVTQASLTAASASVLSYAPETPNRFSFARSKAALKSAWLEMSIRTNMIAKPTRPRYRHHFWIRA